MTATIAFGQIYLKISSSFTKSNMSCLITRVGWLQICLQNSILSAPHRCFYTILSSKFLIVLGVCVSSSLVFMLSTGVFLLSLLNITFRTLSLSYIAVLSTGSMLGSTLSTLLFSLNISLTVNHLSIAGTIR